MCATMAQPCAASMASVPTTCFAPARAAVTALTTFRTLKPNSGGGGAGASAAGCCGTHSLACELRRVPGHCGPQRGGPCPSIMWSRASTTGRACSEPPVDDRSTSTDAPSASEELASVQASATAEHSSSVDRSELGARLAGCLHPGARPASREEAGREALRRGAGRGVSRFRKVFRTTSWTEGSRRASLSSARPHMARRSSRAL
mmetsp:Transcript_13381/g.42029  ORF Transcript_13381/g.42029 Transcript_13381/m.42029 type:complete len:204 (-) Transcript_13381:96-707(-)